MAKEHKEWVRKCLLYRQQVGARLEVLASLADKQIAIEDESAGERAKVTPTAAASKAAAYATSASSAAPQQSAAKKSKASSALARQAAQSKTKAAAAAAVSARAQPAAAPTDSSSNALLSTASAVAPMASPTSFPEPPMPAPVPSQQFGASSVCSDHIVYALVRSVS